MAKVYLIMHDGTNVLVFSGGKRNGVTRPGFHLPGGTIDKWESVIDAAKREFEEETGFPDHLIKAVISFKHPKYGHVNFVVQKVADVNAVAANFVRPVTKNPSDEPFDSVHVMTIADCIVKDRIFTDPDGTEWFQQGIAHGDANGHLL